MIKSPITIEDLRDSINDGTSKDPLVFLESVMNGQDPRKLSSIYELVMEIDGFCNGDLSSGDWSEIVEHVDQYNKYKDVSLNESIVASKTLAEYLYAKRKQVEIKDGSEEFENDDIHWTLNEKRMLKYMLENDGMQFMRYFFKLREGNRMLRNWHHYVIESVLQAVYELKISRLIVNMAPGYSKTEQVVLNFITRGIALNPRAKFIHASYSGDLAHENSSKIKEMISSDAFQDLWPMNISKQ